MLLNQTKLNHFQEKWGHTENEKNKARLIMTLKREPQLGEKELRERERERGGNKYYSHSRNNRYKGGVT